MRLVPSDAWVCVSELSSVVLELKTASGRLVGQEYFLSAVSVPRCRIWAHNQLRLEALGGREERRAYGVCSIFGSKL